MIIINPILINKNGRTRLQLNFIRVIKKPRSPKLSKTKLEKNDSNLDSCSPTKLHDFIG